MRIGGLPALRHLTRRAESAKSARDERQPAAPRRGAHILGNRGGHVLLRYRGEPLQPDHRDPLLPRHAHELRAADRPGFHHGHRRLAPAPALCRQPPRRPYAEEVGGDHSRRGQPFSCPAHGSGGVPPCAGVPARGACRVLHPLPRLLGCGRRGKRGLAGLPRPVPQRPFPGTAHHPGHHRTRHRRDRGGGGGGRRSVVSPAPVAFQLRPPLAGRGRAVFPLSGLVLLREGSPRDGGAAEDDLAGVFPEARRGR